MTTIVLTPALLRKAEAQANEHEAWLEGQKSLPCGHKVEDEEWDYDYEEREEFYTCGICGGRDAFMDGEVTS